MATLKFLHGKDFLTKVLALQPGTFYLDTETGELWFDDPSNTLTDHKKIIDTNTLIYSIDTSFEFSGEFAESGSTESGATTAKLGVAVLGSMILGAN